MRFCVPFCKNTADNVSTSEAEGKGISFHGFPSEVHLRTAWLRALGKQDSHLPDSAVVCSQHFLSGDIYETESGRQIVPGAIPTTVQVCMICLDTDSKMFPMSKHRLEEAYEKLTGHPLCDPGNLKQTLCVQCAQRLINFSRFRDKSLRASALMMDLVDKHELITRRHIKSINRTQHQLKSNMMLTTLGPDHCDLHILEHSSEDQQTELEETGHRVVVKTEGSDDSMSVDEDMGVINEEDNNVDDFVQDALKYESMSFQCTLCLKEFVHEHAYTLHKCIHIQDGDGDGECDTSQACKPHTAVSSSSSHSSLITENKQPDPSPAAHAAHALVAPLPASLATNNELKALPTEEDDTNDNCRYKTLTDCFVKLYDVFTKKGVQRQDGSLMKTKKAVSCCDSHNIPSKDISHQPTRQNEVNATEYSKLCEFKSARRYDLIRHMKTHTAEKPFICEICNKKFTHKRSLVSHMRTHTGEKPFICEICNKKFTHKRSLVSHMRTHTGEKPFTCEICNNKFTQNSSLIKHMRTHTGEKPFTCEICNNKFTQNSNLVRHMRTHTGEKPFTCEICNNKFAHNSSLVKHMRTHTGEKPYACEVCNDKFSEKGYLVSHMRIHTGEKPFTCEICESKFTQNGNLVTHMRTHSGEKPYTCKICSRKFTANRSLVSHMRTHTGEKPYTCKICKRKFADNRHLVSHIRTHTGEKPYSCTICEYRCAHRSSLVSHMRTHTGDKSSPCS